MIKIKLVQTPKMSKKHKEKLGLEGFVPEPLRWIVEAANSWMLQCKSMLRNFESSLAKSSAKI